MSISKLLFQKPGFPAFVLALGLAGLVGGCSSQGSALDDEPTSKPPTLSQTRQADLHRSRFLVKWAEAAPASKMIALADGKSSVKLEHLITLGAGYVMMGVAEDSQVDVTPAEVLAAIEKTPGVVAAELDHDVASSN